MKHPPQSPFTGQSFVRFPISLSMENQISAEPAKIEGLHSHHGKEVVPCARDVEDGRSGTGDGTISSSLVASSKFASLLLGSRHDIRLDEWTLFPQPSRLYSSISIDASTSIICKLLVSVAEVILSSRCGSPYLELHRALSLTSTDHLIQAQHKTATFPSISCRELTSA